MRYYSIQLFNDDGSVANTPDGKPAVWTSFVNGMTNLGALQVDIDVPVTTLATPIGAAMIKIWGVSLPTIGQAANFNGKLIKVYAGMQRGLPLANPTQAGLILQGVVQQAFGNWIDTNQWIEFIVTTNAQTALDQAQNITFTWPKGTAMGDAIKQTLAKAAPTYTATINTSSALVLSEDENGYYYSLGQFAQYVKETSAAIAGADSPGVDILVTETQFIVSDGSSPAKPTLISFQDLVGQPTWIAPGQIQVTTVMRADLQPLEYIKLPPSAVTLSPSDALVPADKSVFQGSFLIASARHVGNFRQPDAASWVTVFDCSPAAVQ